ncbi:MAG: hypothetical protein ACTHMW_03085 [Actinomycetes bacterium]
MGAAQFVSSDVDDVAEIAARLALRFPRLDAATVRRFVAAVARHPSVNLLPGPVRRRQIERLAAAQLSRAARRLHVVDDELLVDLRDPR